MEEVSGRNPTFNCKDVVIQEILTVGPEDEKEYEKWRYQDLSHVHPGIRITTKAVAHRRRKKSGQKRSSERSSVQSLQSGRFRAKKGFPEKRTAVANCADQGHFSDNAL